MSRSQETYNKKEVRNKKEKKRKDKEKKRLDRKENATEGKSFDDMIAYVDENGRLSSTPPDPLMFHFSMNQKVTDLSGTSTTSRVYLFTSMTLSIPSASKTG